MNFLFRYLSKSLRIAGGMCSTITFRSCVRQLMDSLEVRLNGSFYSPRQRALMVMDAVSAVFFVRLANREMDNPLRPEFLDVPEKHMGALRLFLQELSDKCQKQQRSSRYCIYGSFMKLLCLGQSSRQLTDSRFEEEVLFLLRARSEVFDLMRLMLFLDDDVIENPSGEIGSVQIYTDIMYMLRDKADGVGISELRYLLNKEIDGPCRAHVHDGYRM